jgi:cell wall-associated NlpC family hydrolase
MSRPLLLLVFLSLLAACGSIRPAPRYTDSTSSGAVVRELEERRHATPSRLARVVDSYLGIPYKWGGTTRAGMDCSAFTRAIFRETYGVELPRTSKQMYGVGRAIPKEQNLKPGDLVFFKNTYSGPGVSHVGIYIGNGRFAHASSSKGGTITPLDNPYFQPRYIGARRVER